MAGWGIRNRRLGVGLSIGVIASAAPGQEAELPGADFFLDFATGFEVSDNPEGLEDPSGTTAFWQTDLVLGFDSAVRGQRISARLGGTHETGYYADRAGYRGGFTNPFLSVDYGFETMDTLLTLSAAFRERDNGFNEFTDVTTGSDLVVDEGTRRDTDIRLGFELGRAAPFGMTATAYYLDRQYFDTTDPDLADEISSGGLLDFRLSLSRTVALTLGATYDERDEADDENTFETNASVGVGVEVQVNPSLLLSARINNAVNELERTVAGVRTTTETEGPTFRFALEQDRPNGAITASADSSLSSTGTLTSVRFGRSLELRAGRLGFTLGASMTESGEVRPIGSLAWAQSLPRGEVSADFSQSVSSDDDDIDSLNTRLAVRYTRELTALDGLRLSLDVGRSDELIDDGSETAQVGAEVAYIRRLNADWSLTTGYRYGVSQETGQDDVAENRLFANVGRRFSLRP